MHKDLQREIVSKPQEFQPRNFVSIFNRSVVAQVPDSPFIEDQQHYKSVMDPDEPNPDLTFCGKKSLK